MEDYPERSRFDDDQIAYNGNEEFEQPPEQQFEEFEQQREQQSNHNLDNEGNEFRDSFSHRDSAAGKLFVGGVSWETTEENFSNYFSKYGEIVDSVIMIDKHTGKPRGFGFVTFSDPMVIDSVLEVEHVIDGRVVEVKRTVPRGDVGFKGASKRKKIFVGGIPTSLTDDELGEYFSAYGTIVEHQIMLDHKTGRSRGFGFVTFENEDALDKIFSDGKVHELGGKQVEIKKAEPKRGGGDFSGSSARSYGSLSGAAAGYGAYNSGSRHNGKTVLYQSARIFDKTSLYTFPITKQGRHWIRLYFSPFVHGSYNSSTSKFSVSAQTFTLVKELRMESDSFVMEYSLNVTSETLVLTFTPASNSFAFVNALEVVSIPDTIIPEAARTIGSKENNQSLTNKALETVLRVNMGNQTVSPPNDTLWRHWVSDDLYLTHNGLPRFVSNESAVHYTRWLTEDVAPSSVYGTATKLETMKEPMLNANLTWHFDVDPGFEYLVRFHFCDIVSNNAQSFILKVYINSLSVSDSLDLRSLTSNIYGTPYYMDVVIRASDSEKLNVSVGSRPEIVYPIIFLNGLEIMKVSNSKSSLDVLDSSSKTGSKMKVAIVVGLAVGLFTAIVVAAVLFLLCRRRRILAHAIHSNAEDGVLNETESKITDSTAMFSVSKIGYRFPFVAIREATDNFSENLVIGVGGFGKVYKGVLKDNTKVAVKRGAPQSRQGLAEFMTEIEMLSQFRHRHLVSLIGYCDEHNEMIIIYEYMGNGSLKDYLYGSDFPSLSWRQRLGICVGAAKGLHYLHTGSTKAIIHRDVKTANILLDENLMAKVADFGLSKTGPEIDQTHVSTAVKGSFGYLDPEYLTRQQLTEKSDVYSFGVVMFEVLCGRPVIDPSLPRESVNLVEWAMKSHNKGQLEEIVDPCLAGQVKPESLRKFGEIIAKCLAEHGVDRPTVGDVLWNLESVLQLEGSEGSNGRLSSQADHVNPLETSVSIAEFSMGSAGDLAGFSMSKVFAQMVKEDMR